MSLYPLKQRFTKTHLLNLFLICAFPLHLWTLFLFIRDISWITARTNLADAIGAGSYALIYTLIESFVFFFLCIGLSLILPWKWDNKKVYSLLGFIALIIPFWSGVAQITRHYEINTPNIYIDWLIASGHPLRWGLIIFSIGIILLLGSIIVPSFLISFNDRAQTKFLDLLGKVTLLTYFYLSFDLIGLIVIIFRNLPKGA